MKIITCRKWGKAWGLLKGFQSGRNCLIIFFKKMYFFSFVIRKILNENPSPRKLKRLTQGHMSRKWQSRHQILGKLNKSCSSRELSSTAAPAPRGEAGKVSISYLHKRSMETHLQKGKKKHLKVEWKKLFIRKRLP